jgi:hypothetical protein
MTIIFEILKWAGVLINIALVVFLVKLYYQHIHPSLSQRLREKCGEHSASSVSMLVLLVVLFVAGTVLQRGLMEWSSQGLLGSGLIVWLAECVALPLKMLHYIIELPLIWLRAIGDWLTTLTDLFQVLVWPAAAIAIAWLLKGACVQCFGRRQHGER